MQKLLIVTNKCDSHADYMIDIFRSRHVDFVRFNTDDYPVINQLSISLQTESFPGRELYIYGERLRPDNIASVWYRRPLKPRVSHEVVDSKVREFARDEAKALLQSFWFILEDQFWISKPEAIHKWQHKPFQLGLAQKIGFKIPPTLITSEPEEFLEFWKQCGGEVVYKAIGKNMIPQEDGMIHTAYTTKLEQSFLDQADSIRLTPCMFQKYIPKEHELRITVVGGRVFVCEIHSQESELTKIDWRHYDIENTPHLPGKLPQNIEQLCLEIVEVMDLQFGAIDMIVTPDGEYIFIEINPNGQWLWIEQLTGLPIGDALFELLTTYL